MKKKGNYGKINKSSATKPSQPAVRRKRQTKVKTGSKNKGGKLYRYDGVFSATDKGYGFVKVDGFAKDVFISERFTGYAFHGDKVEIELLTPGPLGGEEGHGKGHDDKSREGKVIGILEHSITQIVGTFEEIRNGYGFVIPDKGQLASDLFIPKGSTAGAVTGQKVLARISDYGEFKRSPEGEIVKVIGSNDDPFTDELSVSLALGLKTEFPAEALDLCDSICGDGTIGGSLSSDALDDLCRVVKLSDVFGESFSGKGKRLDIRDVETFTIDGDDSKDYDDAVSLEKYGDDYVVGVSIADVSEYVTEGSALDVEALERGCSVYFPGSVLPMLPEKLSNGLCSLNPHEDRLALSCIMLVDDNGKVKDHYITESVIRSSMRMTYSAVDRALEGTPDTSYLEYAEVLNEMYEVSQVLRKRRFDKGSIEFDIHECEIDVDDKGKVLDVRMRQSSPSRSLIEEFMLLANKTVARHFCKLKIPFAYRVHEDPDTEKIRELLDLMTKLGLSVNGRIYKKRNNADEEGITSSEIASLLDSCTGTPFEILIKTLALRSMQRAKYESLCAGHFGLAFKYYCHFTSPIRRYPDLQIHRIIKETLRGMMDKNLKMHYDEILPEVCRKSSVCERRAQEAEYQVDRLKQIRYMADHMGEEFDGIISGVTRYGVFVKLDNTIEGMISVYDLPRDDYSFDEGLLRLTGKKSRRFYAIGGKVRVKVCAANLDQRTLDFVPV
ncbi:MAG: VacB/RNase II family 3'-5' exoribonuclease [Lachnospiraceae bacterium]|nr:VacB/RNase II family 3'-5' exoribonuclease [Lachnospiraceae bacterium]